MSSRRPIRTKEILYPERILNNLLRDYVDGALDDYTVLYRASVVKVDYVGGALEKDPPNPKNSIRARIITNSRDNDLVDDELPVFYPLFTHDVMPVKEGEHIYVMFEDVEKTHGIWLCRIADPQETENSNYVSGVEKYKDSSSVVGVEQDVQDTDTPPEKASNLLSPDFVVEDVPPFTPRTGDRVLEGSNNTLIVLGRDRITNPASGERELAGTIDIVAGRSSPEDLDMENDKSRIYVTMKSDLDANMGTSGVGADAGPVAGVGLKSDHVRIVARNGFKIVVADSLSIIVEEDGNIKIEAPNVTIASDSIKVGSDNSIEPLVLGNMLVNSVLMPLLTALVTDAGGSPAFGVPGAVQLLQTAVAAPAAQAALAQILSKKHTTE